MDDLAKKVIAGRGHDQPDHVALLFGKRARQLVGLVIQLLHGALYFAGGLRTDNAGFVEHARNGSDRDTRTVGDFL
ncbi:hypothetical protein SDC9_190255 [bioreactor metagenome]|uniref:Uncharacterized protein n=1 Tax=bioreactor metagenome TaxID=1076179 RepID=A0A645HUJ6_9ZZZZ